MASYRIEFKRSAEQDIRRVSPVLIRSIVDFESVTIRDRDSMSQIRVPIAELPAQVGRQLGGGVFRVVAGGRTQGVGIPWGTRGMTR